MLNPLLFSTLALVIDFYKWFLDQGLVLLLPEAKYELLLIYEVFKWLLVSFTVSLLASLISSWTYQYKFFI